MFVEALTGLERPRRSTAASAVGVTLVIIGVALPSSILLGALGVHPVAEEHRLWLGAALFRVGLGTLGLYLVVIGQLPIWGGSTRPITAAAPRSRWTGVVLATILMAALVLRVNHLGAGLWYDEINVYVSYMPMSFGEILTTYKSESQHFLFTLLARAAFALFGEGPASLRLPAVLFGVGSVAALYLFARAVATTREALLSAALLSVSYHHVWFSQNARGYSALLFWTLLSSWLFLRAREEGRSGLWLGYAAAVALGMFTHVTMAFAVLAQAAVYATWLARPRADRGPTAWSGVLLGFGLATLLTFQLYALVVPQFFSVIGMKANVAEWTNPLWTLFELGRGLHTGFAGGAAAVALVMFGFGLLSFARTAPVVSVFVVLPAAVGTTASMAMGHPLFPRFFFFLMGFGVLIAVRGAMMAASAIGRALGLAPSRVPLAGTMVVVLVILASATTVPAAWFPKRDYLGARRFVEMGREPADAIVTVGLATFPYGSLYRAGWEAADSVEALNAIRAQAKRTWVVYTMPLHMKGEHPELTAAIEKDFTLIRKFAGTLNGGTIYVFRSEGAPSGVATPGRRS